MSSRCYTLHQKVTGHANLLRDQCETSPRARTKTRFPTSEDSCFRELDYVTQNARLCPPERSVVHVEDNEAVIKMTSGGLSPSMRPGSWTDWLFDRITLGPNIQMKYLDTRKQLADFCQGELSLMMNDNIFSVCLPSCTNQFLVAVSAIKLAILLACRSCRCRRHMEGEDARGVENRDPLEIFSL